MLYESRTRDFIAAQIAAGHFAYIRSFKLDGHKNEYYVPAVHKMLLNPAVSAWTVHQGVTYLWNVGSPAALEVLQDAHAHGIQQGDARTWMLICEALAAVGDDRGVRDAFEAHVELFETSEPPADEDARKAWEHRREWLAEGAEDILSRAGRQSILEVVRSRLTSDRPAERRAVMELLWQLPATPESVQVALRQWRSECDEEDSEFAQQLLRLLDRDAD